MQAVRTKTWGAVALTHGALVALVCLWGLLQSLRRVDVDVVRVRMVDSGSIAETHPEPPGSAAPDMPQPEPPSPAPTVAEQPELPPEAPVPDSLQPERPTWQPRSAAEIRESAALRQVQRPQPAEPAPPAVNPDEIARRLQQRVRNVRADVALPSPQAAPEAQRAAQRYLDVVSRALYNAWDQPGRAEIGGARPVATVRLVIRSDGSIGSSRLGSSGNDVMDRSVERALDKLPRLPPFREVGIAADSLTITVRFELD